MKDAQPSRPARTAISTARRRREQGRKYGPAALVAANAGETILPEGSCELNDGIGLPELARTLADQKSVDTNTCLTQNRVMTAQMRNQIKKFRTKRGLSQRQLAEAAGTSQAQLQRIEAGVQEARVDLAARICTALGESLENVFPGIKKHKVFNQLADGQVKHEEVVLTEEYSKALEESGLEHSVEAWTVKYLLRGASEEGFWHVSAKEKKRLFRAFQAEHNPGFVIFDSGAKRIAVNPKHLLYWHFLWDVAAFVVEDKSEDEEGAGPLTIHFAQGGTPLAFGVDGDSENFTMENLEAGDERDMQLQILLDSLETGGADEEIIKTVNFVDEDGEVVFFRPAQVSMIEIPLWAVEPDMEQDEDEPNAQEASPAAASPGTSVQ